MSLTARDLLEMSREELDDLFRASPAGPIPSGRGQGTAIFWPDTAISPAAARLVRRLAWQGKVVDPVRGELRNAIGPVGLLAIRAEVYDGDSWLDDQPAVIIDYRETSTVAHWVRDEIRSIGPGLYLGLVFWGRRRILHFSLQF